MHIHCTDSHLGITRLRYVIVVHADLVVLHKTSIFLHNWSVSCTLHTITSLAHRWLALVEKETDIGCTEVMLKEQGMWQHQQKIKLYLALLVQVYSGLENKHVTVVRAHFVLMLHAAIPPSSLRHDVDQHTPLSSLHGSHTTLVRPLTFSILGRVLYGVYSIT